MTAVMEIDNGKKRTESATETEKLLARADAILTRIQSGDYYSRSFVFQKSSKEHFGIRSESSIRDMFFAEDVDAVGK